LLLYYITDRTQLADDEPTRRRRLLEEISEAARCGVDYIQLREKDLAARELESFAREAARVVSDASQSPAQLGTKSARSRLLINSRTDVALACGADGVHLRSDDISASEVRNVWKQAGRSSGPIVSVSCHSSEEVNHAASEGADFVVVAPVFEKNTVTGTVPTGLSALRQTCQEKIPVMALGGVTLENARACMEAGAAGVAGIRLFQDGEIGRAVEILRGLTAR
jgi:thiamine-phosphate pyrophosphorylase